MDLKDHERALVWIDARTRPRRHPAAWHEGSDEPGGTEANLIARREEKAAMRSKADTAELLADNATLMRFRGRGVSKKVATVLTD